MPPGPGANFAVTLCKRNLLARPAIYYMIEMGARLPDQMRMPNRRRYFAPVILVAVALVAMTIGMACHHHTGISDDSNCSICHLGHQPMDRPIDANQAPTFVLVAPFAEAREVQQAPNPVFRRVPTRAPPVA